MNHRKTSASIRSLVRLLALGLSLLPLISMACTNREPTRQTGMGPHYVYEATDNTQLWNESDPGEPVFLKARVTDTCGEPIADARVQIWHADHAGVHHRDRWRADFKTDARGAFKITTVLPGFAGGLPRHIHIIIAREGFEELVTRVFFKNDVSVSEWDSDLAMNVDEIQRDDRRGWVTSFEFVLRPVN